MILTAQPEFEGHFRVFNMKDEHELLRKFFSHIQVRNRRLNRSYIDVL